MRLPFDGCTLFNYPQGSVTQWFGENPVLYQRFGLAFHNGIDFVAPHGTPLVAVEDGTIVAVKTDPQGYGRHVRIRAGNRQWTYGHLHEIFVSEGQKVKEGDVIASMGNSGFVVSGNTPYWEYNPYAGTHLHLGLRMYKGNDIDNYNNGVKGAIDPRQFLQPGPLTQNQKQVKALQMTVISLLNQLVTSLKKKNVR